MADNEVNKMITEQTQAQQQLLKDGQNGLDLDISQTIFSKGPSWYNGTDGTINADFLAAVLIDEHKLVRRNGETFDGNGNRITEADLIDMIMKEIASYFPDKAHNLARFTVLPALMTRLKNMPAEALKEVNDGVASYITQHIKAEIEAFTAASEVKTGFSRFDQLAGGLFPALYVVGAISSLGKTTFIHQMADQLAAAGKHVLFFSLEMSRLELATKSIARRTALMDFDNAMTSLKIRRGYKSNVLVQAAAEYCKAVEDRLNIIEGGFETTVQYIREYAKHYAEKHNTKPVIIVDYLQILQGAQKGTLREAVDFNVVELKRLSRDLDAPVIVISSVNRSNYLLPVDFESFKESGGIEYTADVVLGMQLACLDTDPVFDSAEGKDIAKKRECVKKAKAENPRKVKLVCLKNRYGGPDWTIDYRYYPRFDLFEEEDGYTVVSDKTPFDD